MYLDMESCAYSDVQIEIRLVVVNEEREREVRGSSSLRRRGRATTHLVRPLQSIVEGRVLALALELL